MESVEIANKIQEKILLLEQGRKILIDRAQKKATTAAEYDKQIAITIIKLKNGEQMDVFGTTVKDPPATLIDKIARGVCYKHRLDMDVADLAYKNAIEGMSAIATELNGYQLVNRHLSEL